MNTEIHDAEAMKALSPLEVVAYLRSTGWEEARHFQNRASIWTLRIGDEEFEAAIPLQQSLGDFALRMGDVVQVLAEAEQRSQVDVYSDLSTAYADVVRIRIADLGMRDGTMSIESYAQAAQRTRDLFLAAACAATEPRAVWSSKKPQKAIEHFNRLRIGQTERGSYVIKVISRVSPFISERNGELFEREEPFERQIVKTLAQSLGEMDSAAERSALSGSYASFAESVEKGVNANLCDAVVGLWGGEGRELLEFTFSWSPARPVPASVPRKVRFTEDRISVIKEASRIMRLQAKPADAVVVGPVVKLDRKSADQPGIVTVVGDVDGRARRVLIELTGDDYATALHAHGKDASLRVAGTLVREGRSFRLLHPAELAIEDDEFTPM